MTKLVSARGSRFKLTPDMRLAYNFDDREKIDRMPAARARLEQLKDRRSRALSQHSARTSQSCKWVSRKAPLAIARGGSFR